MCANGAINVNLQVIDCDKNCKYGVVFKYLNSDNYMTFEVSTEDMSVSINQKIKGEFKQLYKELNEKTKISLDGEYKQFKIEF